MPICESHIIIQQCCQTGASTGHTIAAKLIYLACRAVHCSGKVAARMPLHCTAVCCHRVRWLTQPCWLHMLCGHRSTMPYCMDGDSCVFSMCSIPAACRFCSCTCKHADNCEGRASTPHADTRPAHTTQRVHSPTTAPMQFCHTCISLFPQCSSTSHVHPAVTLCA